MQTSLFLAKFLGLFLLFLSLAILSARRVFKRVIKDFIAHPEYSLIIGSISLIMGIFIVSVHNVWVNNWTVVITILGWLIFIFGIMRTLFLGKEEGIERKEVYRPLAVVGLLVGFFLTYMGFFV